MSRYDIIFATLATRGVGPSGYSIIILKDQDSKTPFKELRCEVEAASQYLMAAEAMAAALNVIDEAGDAKEIHIYTGWVHFVRAINTKYEKYVSNGWLKDNGEQIKNGEIQKKLYAYTLKYDITAHQATNQIFKGSEWVDYCRKTVSENIRELRNSKK